MIGGKKIIIFCNDTNRTQIIYERLSEDHSNAACLNSNLGYAELLNHMNMLKSQNKSIFIASDLQSNLSIKGINILLNFDKPKLLSEYFRRARIVEDTKIIISFLTRSENDIVTNLRNLQGTEVFELQADISEMISSYN